MLNILNQRNLPKVIESIRAIEVEFSVALRMQHIDTFANAIAAGGGDEDERAIKAGCSSTRSGFKNEIGRHVGLIGHTGRRRAGAREVAKPSSAKPTLWRRSATMRSELQQ